MIGKIVKGTSFSGCVNYVLKEDKSRLLKAVGVYGSPEEIAEQFELQTLLNDKVKNTVGHISLSFSAEDGDRIRDDDGLMLRIAHDYMKLMGIENTQFIIARIPTVIIHIVISFTTGWIMTAAPLATRTTVTGMKRSARC
jgi:hypothetical protein